MFFDKNVEFIYLVMPSFVLVSTIGAVKIPPTAVAVLLRKRNVLSCLDQICWNFVNA
jgi:hypothetical protein